MLAAIGESLPIAVGLLLAALPMAILAVVLLTKRPTRVARGFLGGWLVGLAVVGALVMIVEDSLTMGNEPAWWVAYAKIAIGALFVFLAVKKWSARKRPEDTPNPPRWMGAVEKLSAVRAFGLAVLMAALNPKHLVLVAAGATLIAETTPLRHEQLVALLVFVIVASLGVAAPVVVASALGPRSAPLLAAADDWLTINSAPIMSALLLVLGVIVLINGVRAAALPS